MRYHKLINLIKPLLFVLALAVFGLLPRKGWAWTSATTITSVGTYSDGHAVVTFADFSGNNACGSNAFSLGLASDPKQKAMLTIANSALLSGKRVFVMTQPGGCQGGQEVVLFLAIVRD
jgi:hypothetical protein